MANPNLGYGEQTEASIDAVNQWMRAQPWYQQIRGNSPKLNESQRQAILRAAQAQGVVVDEGDMEVDPSGNFNPKGHKLRNTLMVAGIAAATLGTMGAAGAFAGGAAGAGGAAAGGGATASAAGAGGVGAGTAAATGGGILSTAGKFLSGGKGIGGYLDTAAQIAGGIASGRAAGRQAENLNNSAYDRAQQDQYRTQILAANNENDFGLGRYNSDLATATGKNNFELGKVNAGLGIGDLDLRQKQFHLDAPGKRAHNSVQGDILANAQDVSVSGLPEGINPPTISGGLRPSMFSGSTRALGGEMSKQALADQKAGDNFAALPSLPEYTGPTTGLPTYVKPPNAPGITPPEQANGFDNFLTTAGTIGSLASLFAKYKPPVKPKPEDDAYIGG